MAHDTRKKTAKRKEKMETVFSVEFAQETEIVTFILRGNIDVHAEAALQGIPDCVTGEQVRFDFSEVGRINSMGIAHLLRCFKRIKEKSRTKIVLTGLSTVHSMLFKTTGIFLLASKDV